MCIFQMMAHTSGAAIAVIGHPVVGVTGAAFSFVFISAQYNTTVTLLKAGTVGVRRTS